nr:MAG TPA: hypothetical protein [Caudoviricetes sp.]
MRAYKSLPEGKTSTHITRLKHIQIRYPNHQP